MKNKTLKLFVPLLTALYLSACSENKSISEYLTEAQLLIQKEEYSEAIIQLKNAVRLEPKDASTRILLGKSYLMQGNYVSAEKELSKAFDLGGDVTETTFYLVQSLSKLHEYEEVYKLADEAVTLNDADYIAILTFAGISAVVEGDMNKASDYLNQAISIDKESNYGQLASGYLAYINKDYVKGSSIVAALGSFAPQISETLLLSGYIAMSQENFKGASESFSRYLDKHPQAGYVKLLEINSLINNEQIELAEKKVDRVLEVYQEATLAKQFKAQIAYLKNDYRTAMEFADKSIITGGDNQYVRTIAGVSAFKDARFELAYQHLKTIQNDMDNNSSIKKLFVFLQLKLGYQLESEDVFSDTELFDISDAELLGDTSLSLLDDGKSDLANKAINKAVELKPNDARLLTLKARMGLDDNIDNSVALFKQALNLSPEMKAANVLLAKTLMDNGEFDEALSVVRKWRYNNNQNAESWVMEGVIHLKEKNYNESLKAFRQALTIDNKNVSAGYYKGISLTALQQYQDATAAFKDVLANNINNLSSLMKIIQLEKLGLISDQTQYLVQQHEANITSPQIFFARLLQNYHTEQFKSAIDVFNQYKNNYQLDDNIYLLVAKLYAKIGSQNKVIESYQYIVDRSPSNALANIGLVSSYIETKNLEQAKLHVDKVLKAFPSNETFLILKARLQFSKGNIDATKDFLNSYTVKGESISPAIKALQADVAYLEKNFVDAEKHYKELVLEYPTKKNTIRLAFSLSENNKNQQAIKILTDYLSVHPSDAQVKILLAELKITKDSHSAITYYQKLLEQKANNPGLLNNLAWAQLQAGKHAEALLSIEKAYVFASKHPKIIDTYANILVANGDLKRALTLFSQANALAPNDNEILIHYIETLVLKGDLSEAKVKLAMLDLKTLTAQEKKTISSIKTQF